MKTGRGIEDQATDSRDCAPSSFVFVSSNWSAMTVKCIKDAPVIRKGDKKDRYDLVGTLGDGDRPHYWGMSFDT